MRRVGGGVEQPVELGAQLLEVAALAHLSLDVDARAAAVEDEGGEVAAVVMDPPYAIYGSSTGIGSDIADDRMVRPFFAQVFNTGVTDQVMEMMTEGVGSK